MNVTIRYRRPTFERAMSWVSWKQLTFLNAFWTMWNGAFLWTNTATQPRVTLVATLICAIGFGMSLTFWMHGDDK